MTQSDRDRILALCKKSSLFAQFVETARRSASHQAKLKPHRIYQRLLQKGAPRWIAVAAIWEATGSKWYPIMLTPDVREAHRNRMRTEEVRAAIGAANVGKVFSPEVRFKISQTQQLNGHYGISWDRRAKSWQVFVRRKYYGRFKRIIDALMRRDEVLAMVDQTMIALVKKDEPPLSSN